MWRPTLRSAFLITVVFLIGTVPVSAGKRLVSAGATVTASNTLSGYAPANVVDGNPATMWNAGQSAEQWIELDLGAAVSVSKIRLWIEQSPMGATRHEVYGGETPDPVDLLCTFTSITAGGARLTFAPAAPAEHVRYIRVITTNSPSWIAWREIEVYTPN